MVAGGIIGAGWGALLGLAARRLGRDNRRAAALASGSLFAATVGSGILFGGSMFDMLQLSLSRHSPEALMALMHPPLFQGANVFFIIFNSLMEALLVPAALFANWRHPRRRSLILAAALPYYLQRAVTYLYFIPAVYAFSATPAGGPYPPELIEQVRLWVDLSWLRGIADAWLFLGLLGAAIAPAALPALAGRRPPVRRGGGRLPAASGRAARSQARVRPLMAFYQRVRHRPARLAHEPGLLLPGRQLRQPGWRALALRARPGGPDRVGPAGAERRGHGHRRPVYHRSDHDQS
jgi:hypothetical protein